MKKNITLKLIALLALLLGGVNVQAQGDLVITPSAEKWYRVNSDYGYNSSDYPKDYTEIGKYEIRYTSVFFVLQQFTFPEDINWSRVKSISIINTEVRDESSSAALGYWIYSGDFPINSNNSDSEETRKSIIGCVENVIGLKPNSTSGDYNQPLVSTTQKTTGDYNTRTATISGDALSTFKTNVREDNTINFVITRENPINVSRAFIYSANGDNIVDGNDLRTRLCIEYYPVINATTNVGYETLNEAVDAATGDATFIIYDDVELTERINTSKDKSFVFYAAKDGITIKRTPSVQNSLLFLNNVNGESLTIGGNGNRLIIDGGDLQSTAAFIECSGGTNEIKDVTIQNVKTSHKQGVLCYKSGGTLKIENITFSNCIVNNTEEPNAGIIFCGLNDLKFSGSILFDNCQGHNVYLENKRLEDAGLSTPITLFYKTPAINANVVIRATEATAGHFILMNDGYGLALQTNGDMKLREAYTLGVNKYGAATLVLPYEANIPEDVKVYTLTCNANDEKVSATEVTGSLPANTPVLVNAQEGKYKFVSALEAAATLPTENPVSGVLTGVYSRTDVPGASYILWADDTHEIGFWQATETATAVVGANHAYLTMLVSYNGAKKITIDFGSVTGIEGVKQVKEDDGAVYNMSGMRVTNPVQKGIYIKNGKKFIVK